MGVQAQAWKGEVNADIPALEAKAQEGDPAAMAEYAFHSLRCLGGVKYQPKRIFDLFTRSAEAGNEEGKVGLAHCYCFNVGTIRDLHKAEKLVEEPFANDHPVAQKVMGFFYYGKQGVRPKDIAKVVELNQQSAEQGCVAAQYNLAIGYTYGRPELDVERGMNELRAMHEAGSFALASGFLLKCLTEHEIWPDHEEVFQSCVQRISELSDLNEPYCLYRLGWFHHDAGDLENAISCYAQSAHLGYGEAYFQLWRLVEYGRRDDFGTIWTQNRHRGNLALLAYERGSWSSSSLFDAGWEITRMGAWHDKYQRRFPQLAEDCLVDLNNDKCRMHDILGRIYGRAKAKTIPDFAKMEWAHAHLLAHPHHGSNSPGELANYYFDEKKSAESLARGYLCAKRAAKMGHSRWGSEKSKKWLEKQLTPEAKKRVEELQEENFPIAKKFRREAEEFLIELGHLKEMSEELRD